MLNVVLFKNDEDYSGFLASKPHAHLTLSKMEALELERTSNSWLIDFYEASMSQELGANTLFLEHPDICLHPCHKPLIAKQALALSQEYGVEITLVTHSKTIINSLGDEIEDNQDKGFHDHVAITILKGNREKKSHFDFEGDLMNWPIGYFCREVTT